MKRSKFGLSHYKLVTCDMGKLIPVSCFEALPGDTIQHRTSALIRMTPLNTPVMHPVLVRFHHWFCPYRILWNEADPENWESFITGGEDGTETPSVPSRDFGAVSAGDLINYLGHPVGDYNGSIIVLALRAYQKIWNEWYRDQQLQTEAVIDYGSGNDTNTDDTLQNVCWPKDYLTSARPDSALGTAVTIPLTGDAPVAHDAANASDLGAYSTVNAAYHKMTADTTYVQASGTSTTEGQSLYADLTSVSGVEINDLRLALAVQRYQERINKYGNRYSEWLLAQGVNPKDARLQRPEYLGGGRQTVQFSEVLNMTDDGTRMPGSMYGHGISAMRTNRYRKFIEEHGIIMTLMSIVPVPIYVNGLPRMWVKTTKEDFFQKELAFIGDQEVYNSEVKVDHSDNTLVFGYQSRYDEYRKIDSQVAGQFDSTYNTWHLGRDFGATDPALNSSFVACSPSTRIFQSDSYDTVLGMINHSVVARRMIPRVAKNRTF